MMIDKLLLLANDLNALGYQEYSNRVKRILAKVSVTKCIASFKFPIQFSNGTRINMFEYKVSSPNQLLTAIPHMLGKKHHEVWYLNKKYELPSQANILGAKLIEEKNAGFIVCECYIDT